MRKLLVTFFIVFFVSGCLQKNSNQSQGTMLPTVSDNDSVSSGADLNDDQNNTSSNPPSFSDFPVNLQLEISSHSVLRTLSILWKDVPYHYTFTLCAQSSSHLNQCKPIKTGKGSDGISIIKLGTDFSLEQLINNQLFIQFFSASGALVERIELVIDRETINSFIQYIKASNLGRNDQFGTDVAISSDGKILAVSAPLEDTFSSNINSSLQILNAGAVYIFIDTEFGWKQSAFIKFSHPDAEDNFGTRIALSDDGLTLAVAMPNDDSFETGVADDPSNNNLVDSGSVIIFTNDVHNRGWRQHAILKASKNLNFLGFGSGGLALSADGRMLAVGTLNNLAVETFMRDAYGNWTVFETISPVGVERADKFGEELAFNADGSVLAISAAGNDSNHSFIDAYNNLLTNSGGVYIFRKTLSGAQYWQSAFFKPLNPQTNSFFGNSISLSANGNTLAVGSNIYSTSTNNVFVYDYDSILNTWKQRYIIAPTPPHLFKRFGFNVEISKDASLLAVHSQGSPPLEGIHTELEPEGRVDLYGHLFVFDLQAEQAVQKYSLSSLSSSILDDFGRRSVFSRDNKVLATTARGDDLIIKQRELDINAPINSGAAFVFHF